MILWIAGTGLAVGLLSVIASSGAAESGEASVAGWLPRLPKLPKVPTRKLACFPVGRLSRPWLYICKDL